MWLPENAQGNPPGNLSTVHSDTHRRARVNSDRRAVLFGPTENFFQDRSIPCRQVGSNETHSAKAEGQTSSRKKPLSAVCT
uniref:Uncharacterized protein n=1 Tax=uncultured Rhodobacterales bacterium HF4000_03E16 TaxID=710785 RepID=E0XV72_9RHOB|nr:hypothetical protein [uncultured Rhodobacterales bacterium HF4000_03E16]